MPRVYKGLDVESDFEGRFPWISKEITLADKNKMAYLDEGPQDAPLTFLLVHGNPTWGYLYREFVRELSEDYRVVVPDLLGFGRSDKPTDPAAYSLEKHIASIELLAKELRLRNVVLVVQDWGGPIGLGYATRHPKDIAGVVVLNTWAFVGPDGGVKLPWFFRFLVLGKGGWRRVLARNTFTELFIIKSQRVDEISAAAYRAPHPTPKERVGVARFPQMIPQIGDTGHESYATMAKIEEGLATLRDKPACIVWPMRDVAFRKAQLTRWQQVFPNHDGPHTLPDAKHYVQEDHSKEILAHVRPWVERLVPPPPPAKPKAARSKKA